MDFIDQIKQFSKRVESLKDNIATEEATKTSLIMPFFSLLGYDVFNPQEFVPEFTCDVGIKKGEKVDYAIIIEDKPVILIEAKWIGEPLEKHDSQLFRYFGTTCAKFSILTNGAIYRFYTDLEEKNKMDTAPFLEINLLDLDENKIPELKKFCKENFDESNIFNTAAELKYMSLIQGVLKEQFSTPSDDFVRFILSSGVYDGVKTQQIIEKYKPLVKRSISLYINDLVNEKIQNALKEDGQELPADVSVELPKDDTPDAPAVEEHKVSEEDLQAFYIIRAILSPEIPLERITYKNTRSYLAILIDDKVTRWLCRILTRGTKSDPIKYIVFFEDNEFKRYNLPTLDELYNFKENLLTRAQNLC